MKYVPVLLGEVWILKLETFIYGIASVSVTLHCCTTICSQRSLTFRSIYSWLSTCMRMRAGPREKMRIHLGGGMIAMPQSSFILLLEFEAHVPNVIFQPLNPGLELWSTRWESSTLTPCHLLAPRFNYFKFKSPHKCYPLLILVNFYISFSSIIHKLLFLLHSRQLK